MWPVDAGVVGNRTRVFAGKDQSGTAKLALSDGDGKPRLVLSVDRGGAAKIELLDATGRVVQSIVPPR